MSKEVITVSEDTPLEEAARIMADQKIGGLPVMQGKTLSGIITETDLFKVLMELLGGRRVGVRATVSISGAKGTLAKITSAVFGAGGDRDRSRGSSCRSRSAGGRIAPRSWPRHGACRPCRRTG